MCHISPTSLSLIRLRCNVKNYLDIFWFIQGIDMYMYNLQLSKLLKVEIRIQLFMQ